MYARDEGRYAARMPDDFKCEHRPSPLIYSFQFFFSLSLFLCMSSFFSKVVTLARRAFLPVERIALGGRDRGALVKTRGASGKWTRRFFLRCFLRRIFELLLSVVPNIQNCNLLLIVCNKSLETKE